ncbi:hypothetical protein T459_00001 [Capsicum annuum]|uniref:TPX2 C-terminal domain-containing protein n=1 Tax=Capsicum annuum TaxID=4072 RepID=A0A2G3ACZ3_CAPAN|nr:hypothetical protein T459_00001 [Capsicum annuum]
MKIEEKVHDKEEETRQVQARTQEKKEEEIKQLWRNLNFKATSMPAFYREPDHRSEKTKIYNRKRNADCSFDLCCAMCRKRKKKRLNSYREISISKKLPCLPSIVNQTTAQIKSRKRNADCSFDLHCAMYRERKKQRSNSYGEISISKQLPCPPSTMNLTTAQKNQEEKVHTKEEETRHLRARKQAAGARDTSATENTNEHLNVADSPQVSELTIHPSAELSNSSVPSVSTSKTSKQTQSNRTVAPKREQEKRQVANYPRPRTSDSIRRNKDFKAEDKTKVLARRKETMQRERMLEV